MIIHKLLAAKMDRAELFFRSARSMCDRDSGFEDADFWSVQALSLMTVYMLAVSKRNRAYAYLGMNPDKHDVVMVTNAHVPRHGCPIRLRSWTPQGRDDE